MRDDPLGHYQVLGLDPGASGAAVAAAFRAAARRVHPDVPGTGNADAFMRVRAAYDVLADPERRAEYDREGRAAAEAEAPADPADGETEAAPAEDSLLDALEPAPVEIPAVPWTRPAGLAAGLWAGGAALAVLALAIGLFGLSRSRPPPPLVAAAGPIGPPAAAPAAATRSPAALPSPPAPTDAAATGYVLPAGEPATLWRRGAEDGRLLPAGQLAAFTPLATGEASAAAGGMVAVRAPDGRAGFVYADRVTPGDAAAAERARCIYDAGSPPANNEILARRGSGPAAILVQNLRDQPAVLKLRDAAGVSAASVFIAPRGSVTVDRLPAGEYRPEFAFGELWSHGCGRFMAGMRPQRFAAFEPLGGTPPAPARYTLPPDDPIDETDEEFNRQ